MIDHARKRFRSAEGGVAQRSAHLLSSSPPLHSHFLDEQITWIQTTLPNRFGLS
jgi:hypothetical protein